MKFIFSPFFILSLNTFFVGAMEEIRNKNTIELKEIQSDSERDYRIISSFFRIFFTILDKRKFTQKPSSVLDLMLTRSDVINENMGCKSKKITDFVQFLKDNQATHLDDIFDKESAVGNPWQVVNICVADKLNDYKKNQLK